MQWPVWCGQFSANQWTWMPAAAAMNKTHLAHLSEYKPRDMTIWRHCTENKILVVKLKMGIKNWSKLVLQLVTWGSQELVTITKPLGISHWSYVDQKLPLTKCDQYWPTIWDTSTKILFWVYGEIYWWGFRGRPLIIWGGVVKIAKKKII